MILRVPLPLRSVFSGSKDEWQAPPCPTPLAPGSLPLSKSLPDLAPDAFCPGHWPSPLLCSSDAGLFPLPSPHHPR